MGYTELSMENRRKIGTTKINSFPRSFMKYYACSNKGRVTYANVYICQNVYIGYFDGSRGYL